MEEIFELAIKVNREEIPDDFDDFRRFVMETPEGELIVISRSEYMEARKASEAGRKAGEKK